MKSNLIDACSGSKCLDNQKSFLFVCFCSCTVEEMKDNTTDKQRCCHETKSLGVGCLSQEWKEILAIFFQEKKKFTRCGVYFIMTSSQYLSTTRSSNSGRSQQRPVTDRLDNESCYFHFLLLEPKRDQCIRGDILLW